MSAPEINLPEVVAEVQAVFDRYERALVGNDVAVLTELFWHSPHTVRYGIAENLMGWDAIVAFRQARPAVDLDRDLSDDRDHHLRPRLRHRQHRVSPPGSPGRRGRQSQTWVRMAEGWRVVAAHVSLLPE